MNSSCCLQPNKYMCWHISSKIHGYLTLKFNPRHVKNYFIDYPYKEMYYVQITMSALCLFLLQLQIRFFLSCWANVRPSVECNYLNQTNGQPLMVQQNIRIELSQFALEVVSWNVEDTIPYRPYRSLSTSLWTCEMLIKSFPGFIFSSVVYCISIIVHHVKE